MDVFGNIKLFAFTEQFWYQKKSFPRWVHSGGGEVVLRLFSFQSIQIRRPVHRYL
jgi:hypothetical protein